MDFALDVSAVCVRSRSENSSLASRTPEALAFTCVIVVEFAEVALELLVESELVDCAPEEVVGALDEVAVELEALSDDVVLAAMLAVEAALAAEEEAEDVAVQPASAPASATAIKTEASLVALDVFMRTFLSYGFQSARHYGGGT